MQNIDRLRLPLMSRPHLPLMPMPLIFTAREILSGNDWSWAKSALNHSDWLNVDGLQIWSPVRANALYVKLSMPFRTLQVRMMDDGSSDTYVFDEIEGTMVPNPGPFKQGNARAPVQFGAIQVTKTGRKIIVVPTRNQTFEEPLLRDGASVSAPDDVFTLLVQLRRWQEANNPISGRTSWRQLKELKAFRSEKESCFLFRDPTNELHPDEPISTGCIHALWLRLLQELERRLAEQDIVGFDSQPIKLISAYDRRGNPSSAVFGLHSLRNSMEVHASSAGGRLI
jgi:hypothetical protein